ncbi:MAG: aminotransferase class V-fold PLP-dependent enzyme [Acidobacteriota bacterium]|nr:aminotransferase class V-fold PLP-dependent enzyme [Acidobacteriota bacterium]
MSRDHETPPPRSPQAEDVLSEDWPSGDPKTGEEASSLIPPIDPQAFRWQGDGDEPVLWVMHCSEGPVPAEAVASAGGFLDKEAAPWRIRWVEDFQGIPQRVRRAAGKVLGCAAEDVTLTATTSTALGTIAQGYPWRSGDEVVVPLGEFPSNLWPWRTLAPRGVGLREVPLWDGHRAGAEALATVPPTLDAEPEQRLLDAIGPATRVLAVSWVRFQDGLRLDLPRLAEGCRRRGVDLVVDGIQGAGCLPPTLEGVAAFATGCHKGLLAPQGMGLLWTSPELRQRLTPPGGWLSVEDATDFQRPSTDFDRGFVAGGEALEMGVPNLLGCAALTVSLELIAAAGLAAIAAHVDALQELFLGDLHEIPDWRQEARRLELLRRSRSLGPILSLHHGGRGGEVLEELMEEGFQRGIYSSVREGYLRIAFHGWHTSEDVERLLRWLAEL